MKYQIAEDFVTEWVRDRRKCWVLSFAPLFCGIIMALIELLVISQISTGSLILLGGSLFPTGMCFAWEATYKAFQRGKEAR